MKKLNAEFKAERAKGAVASYADFLHGKKATMIEAIVTAAKKIVSGRNGTVVKGLLEFWPRDRATLMPIASVSSFRNPRCERNVYAGFLSAHRSET